MCSGTLFQNKLADMATLCDLIGCEGQSNVRWWGSLLRGIRKHVTQCEACMQASSSSASASAAAASSGSGGGSGSGSSKDVAPPISCGWEHYNLKSWKTLYY